MIKRIHTVLIAALTAMLCSVSMAHHSTAMFDASKTMTLQGTVKKFMFTNPHSWLYVTVTDAEGKTADWELEGGSTSHMARNGWTYKTLKAGDKITVVINPRTDGATGGAFKSVTLSDGTVMGSAPII